MIIGDLKVIKENKLRKRFTKDSKYRKPTEKDFVKAMENISYSIGDCILARSQKHGMPDAVLLE